MGQTGTQLKEVRDKNAIPQRIPLFTLQGNFDVKKLHGAYRFMRNVMVKIAGNGLANKTDRTPEEDDIKMNIHKNKMLWYNTKCCIRASYERS